MQLRGLPNLLSLVLALLLSGCQTTVPEIRTAEVQAHSKSPTPATYSLTSQQVAELNVWFVARRGGWSTSPASYVPKLVVRAKHSDGTESVVNILDTSLVINSTSPSITNQVTRNLSTAEHQALQQLLLRR